MTKLEEIIVVHCREAALRISSGEDTTATLQRFFEGVVTSIDVAPPQLCLLCNQPRSRHTKEGDLCIDVDYAGGQRWSPERID